VPPGRTDPKALRAALKKSAQGDEAYQWLRTLLIEAGYVPRPPAPLRILIRQSELVGAVPGLTRATLLAWEARGLPTATEGGAKTYELLEYLKFLHREFVGRGRPATSDGVELLKWKARSERFNAELRRVRFELQTKKTIPRSEAEAELVALILVVKAALLAMPAALGRQLENVPATTARQVIEAHVRWLCSRMKEGRPPIPPAAERAIERALAKVKG